MTGSFAGNLYERRWLATIRGGLLVLLRRATCAVDVQAQALDVMDNPVRARREGLPPTSADEEQADAG